MKVSKKIIIIAVAVIVLLIGGGVVYATNSPTARAERQLNLGNKYLQEGKYQEAILAFEKVIQIDPKNIHARLGLGNIYIATKKFDKAESVLKEVTEIDKNNIPAREELFRVYIKENKLDVANSILQEIIQIDSNKDVTKLKENLNNAIFSNASEIVNKMRYTDQEINEHKKEYSNGYSFWKYYGYVDNKNNLSICCVFSPNSQAFGYSPTANELWKNLIITTRDYKILDRKSVEKEIDMEAECNPEFYTSFEKVVKINDHWFGVIFGDLPFKEQLVRAGYSPGEYVFVNINI